MAKQSDSAPNREQDDGDCRTPSRAPFAILIFCTPRITGASTTTAKSVLM